MLALDNFHVDWPAIREALIDATTLTIIVAPVTYYFMIKPFIVRASIANADVQAQADRLNAALADLTVQKRILDNHCLVTRTDVDGNITYANDEFCRLSGYAREEVLGKNHRILKSGYHEPQFWIDMFATLARDGVWQGQVCNRIRDGRTVWVQATNVAERDDAGRIKGYFSVRSDISATKLREVELANAQAALREAMKKAEAASDAKSRFLSTMSHEMRTPLNGVIGAMELLKLESLSSRQEELVNLALESSDALLAQINDVLDFSKLEAGKLDLTLAPFDIRRLVKSVCEIVSHRAFQQGNRLTTEVAEALPERFVGDPVRLRQILLNFASNASKFTRNGKISVCIEPVQTSGDAHTLEFSVADTGIGMAADRLGELFKEFSMLDSSLTRKFEGTGLGLAICKRLVEAMGGTIGVASELGQGSRFWFRVELKACNETVKVAASDGPVAGSGRKLKILLADDNATNRLVGLRLLASMGHLVDAVASGREAVEAADTSAYDVILMDISMPEMDGIEATGLIRAQSQRNRATPIIALTAHAVIGDRERFIKAGMSEYLSKPLRLGDLRARLESVAPSDGESAAARDDDAPPASSDAIGILDRSELDALAAETSRDVVAEVVREYRAEARVRVANLVRAIAAGDTGAAQRLAHALAGASASVGAVGLSGLAKRIELECIAGKLETAGPDCKDLPGMLARTEAALREAVADGARAAA